MSDTTVNLEAIEIRLARAEEIEAVQRLRYKVFYEELAAIPTEEMKKLGRDINEFDEVADILVVLDNEIEDPKNRIVGTYRLLRQEVAEKYGHFYTSDEYDISPLQESGEKLLEVGRSCVLEPYRTRLLIQKMWAGIADYVAKHKIGLMFGCASFPGTDVSKIEKELSYLYHYHLADPAMCPSVLPQHRVEMNLIPKEELDAKRVFAGLPPLVKGYLRLGASIGDGAFIDRQWNSVDVCIVMPTLQVTERYMRHYQRGTEKNIPKKEELASKMSVEGRS